MNLGLILNTCGITSRDDNDWWHQPTDADQIRPVESAQLAERFGYHSVFMGDHVSLKEESPESVSPVHVDGRSDESVRQRGRGWQSAPPTVTPKHTRLLRLIRRDRGKYEPH